MRVRSSITSLFLLLTSCHGLHFLSFATSRQKQVVMWGSGRIQRVGLPESDDMEDLSLADDDPQDMKEEDITIPSFSLEDLLSPPRDCDVTQIGPTTLAYIGDVVFELFVRSRMVWPTRRTSDLQLQVVSLVRAEHQATLLSILQEKFDLSQQERQIIVRGRNSGSVKGNRRKTPAYNDATALEALIGYVYIGDKQRCTDILNFLYAHLLELDATDRN